MSVSKEKVTDFNDFCSYIRYAHGCMDKDIAKTIGRSNSVLSDAKRGKLTQVTIDIVRSAYHDDYIAYLNSKPADTVQLPASPSSDRELYIHYKAKYDLLMDQYTRLLNRINKK